MLSGHSIHGCALCVGGFCKGHVAQKARARKQGARPRQLKEDLDWHEKMQREQAKLRSMGKPYTQPPQKKKRRRLRAHRQKYGHR